MRASREVIDEILLLLMDLGATDEQLDSPMVFCSGRAGTASYSPDVEGQNLEPLFKRSSIMSSRPRGNPPAPLAMLCAPRSTTTIFVGHYRHRACGEQLHPLWARRCPYATGMTKNLSKRAHHRAVQL